MDVLTQLLVIGGPLVIVFVAIAISFRRFARANARRDAKLSELAPTRIKDLVAGARVRIIGTAVGTKTVPSPYSKTPCLAFDCSSSATLKGDGSLDGSMPISDTLRGPTPQEVHPFHVDDGTGTIGVVIQHVKLELHQHIVSDADNHAFGAKLIAREATSSSYWEGILEPDMKVAVIGLVMKAEDGTLRIAGTAEVPAVVSNRSAALRP